MIIEKNSAISIVYELRNGSKDGEIVETVASENPLQFVFGTNGLLPKFEEHLSGLTTGDNFEFLLNMEDAYGPVVENAVVDVPKSVFEIDGKIDENLMQVGSLVPMMDAQGNRLNGNVIAVGEDTVKMDFNHPMAGNDLFFKGEVIEVREATEEELSHGHVHAEGGCGCGGDGQGSCGDGDCEDKGSCNDDGGQGGCGC